MNELFLSLISTTFLSGTVGYISYFIIQETTKLYFNERESDEKKAFIGILSLLTFLIIITLYTILSLIIEIKIKVWICTLVLTVILMGIINFKLMPSTMEWLTEKINNSRLDKNLAVWNRESKRNIFFQKNEARYIYMFTLDGKYITSGTLISTTLESDMYQEYVLSSGDGPGARTINEIEEAYSENSFDIFIDVENSIQIYSHIPK